MSWGALLIFRLEFRCMDMGLAREEPELGVLDQICQSNMFPEMLLAASFSCVNQLPNGIVHKHGKLFNKFVRENNVHEAKWTPNLFPVTFLLFISIHH